MSDSTESIILVTVITATVPAIFGLVIWYFKSKYNERNEDRKLEADRMYSDQQETAKKELNEQINRYAMKIKDFYYPIYIRLVANEQAYRKVIGPRASQTIPLKIRKTIMQREILTTHEQIIKIIIENAHMVEGDSTLLYEFIKYTQHVAVLKTIYHIKNCDISAKDLGSFYPESLLPTLHNRFMRDSKTYNELIGYTVYQDNTLLSSIQDPSMTIKNVLTIAKMATMNDDSITSGTRTHTTESSDDRFNKSVSRSESPPINHEHNSSIWDRRNIRTPTSTCEETIGDRSMDISSLSKMRDATSRWEDVMKVTTKRRKLHINRSGSNRKRSSKRSSKANSINDAIYNSTPPSHNITNNSDEDIPKSPPREYLTE